MTAKELEKAANELSTVELINLLAEIGKILSVRDGALSDSNLGMEVESQLMRDPKSVLGIKRIRGPVLRVCVDLRFNREVIGAHKMRGDTLKED